MKTAVLPALLGAFEGNGGMPVPIAFHLGTLDVIEDGVGSLVVYSQQVQPDELGAVIGPAVGAAIDGIHRYFEGAGTARHTGSM